MWYRYDDYGWYAGDIIGTDTSRATQAEPPSLAAHTNEGVDRANFSGGFWSMIPYSNPVYDVGDLEPARALKKLSLYNDMKISEVMPILYQGDIFPTDYDIRSDIIAAIAIGTLPSGFFWFDVNKYPVFTDDINYMRGLAASIAARKMQYYVVLSGLNAAVDAATTEQEISAVEWSAS